MNKETRIQKIVEIIDREKSRPYGITDIPWEDVLKPMPVYKIPLNLLVYNKYNGRILSRTKSLEQQGQQIDNETETGRNLIEKLLWDSDPGRNKQTQNSIEKIGQEKVGIITRDGVIIDGNRRAMLLRRSGEVDHFKTVVLDVTLAENSNEIEKLETSYQMGEDEKLTYNPIEKYLKTKFLSKRGVPIEDIAKWMNESKSKIEELLAVMNTMDDYLDYLECNGIYTQLDGREDQFITLTKQLNNFKGEQSKKPFDGYKEDDVDDLRLVSYDYIRVKYEGKEFRNIAYGNRENHFFGDKKIWQNFRDFHFAHVQPIKDAEEKIDFANENLTAYLNDRDRKFLEKSKNENGKSFFSENIDSQWQQIQYKKSHNEPEKLVNNAIDALGAIDQGHKAFSTPTVMKKVEAINEIAIKMLKDSAPERLLSQVIRMLKSINCEDGQEVKEDMLSKIREIGQIAYQMRKDIEAL
jgi:hypothetical protein